MMMSGIVLKLLLLSATKKVAVYTIARVYGFKNLYRKGLRLSNSTLGKHSQLTTNYKHLAKGAIRLPYTVSAHIKSVTFIGKRKHEQGGKGLKLISGEGSQAQSDKISGRQSPDP